jgi:hypothetical protein
MGSAFGDMRQNMNDWTPELVEERLNEAAAVMRRLPAVRVQGYFNTWPKMKTDFDDLIGQAPEPMRLPPPTAAAITRMEEALAWLRWLEVENVKLVWMRAERAPWKAICWRFGIARTTANRRWDYAVNIITWRLNHRPISAKWSQRFLLERSRLLSRNF